MSVFEVIFLTFCTDKKSSSNAKKRGSQTFNNNVLSVVMLYLRNFVCTARHPALWYRVPPSTFGRTSDIPGDMSSGRSISPSSAKRRRPITPQTA